MRGLRLTFSTMLRICEKCDLEQPSHRFAIFFDFESIDFRIEMVCFSVVFSKPLFRHTFFDFGWIFCRFLHVVVMPEPKKSDFRMGKPHFLQIGDLLLTLTEIQ